MSAIEELPNLTTIFLCNNRDIDSECFGMILEALDGGHAGKLFLKIGVLLLKSWHWEASFSRR